MTSATGYDKFTRTEANDRDGMLAIESSNIHTPDIEMFSQELRFGGQHDRLD